MYFHNVANFKYMETTLTNQSFIYEEIKGRLNSGNSLDHSDQDLLSSSLPAKNLNIKIHRSIIFPVVLYGCETWSLTLREEHRLRMFEYCALRKIFGPKVDDVIRGWRKLHNKEINDLYSKPNIIWVIN